MASFALICPQCGGPLPRQAMWRMVTCPHCKAVVTQSSEVVQRAPFRDALRRSQGTADSDGRRTISAGAQTYAIVATLGRGRSSTVLLADRVGPLPARVVVKLARDAAGASALAAEASHLEALQAIDNQAAARMSMRLPQPLYHGPASDVEGVETHALVVRHVDGVWGSLAALHAARPEGLDPRHAVWIWRRGLETLGFVHRAGWTHGEVGPEHLLVHPAGHAIFVIGWAGAELSSGEPLSRHSERDLRQLAWSVRALLQGASAGAAELPARVPAPLARLLRSATDDLDWQRGRSAESIDQALVEAAAEAFGAPRFVPFDPLAPGGLGPA